MDELQSLERMLRLEEKRLDDKNDRMSEELRRAIEETKRKMRAAFAGGKKIHAALKEERAGT